MQVQIMQTQLIGKVGEWNDEVTANGRTQMSAQTHAGTNNADTAYRQSGQIFPSLCIPTIIETGSSFIELFKKYMVMLLRHSVHLLLLFNSETNISIYIFVGQVDSKHIMNNVMHKE